MFQHITSDMYLIILYIVPSIASPCCCARSLPKYCYTGIPELMSTASKDFRHPKDNFLRGAKW